MGFPGAAGSPKTSLTIRVLLGANLILLGMAWVLSIYGYARLPQDVPSWLALWKGGLPLAKRSLGYFVYPVFQIVFFLALLGLAKEFFLKEPKPGAEGLPLDTEGSRRLRALKREVVYLALIFVNLVFIHLQTSLTLLAHQAVTGFNRYYLAMLLVMIVFIAGPYFRIRRKIIRTERDR